MYVALPLTSPLYAQDRIFRVGDLPLARGEAGALANVAMTVERYGPVMLLGLWDADQDAPIYLITALAEADVAARQYRLRFRIECMFADHKSRGFHSHTSHLSQPARLARLVVATSLAYLWVMRWPWLPTRRAGSSDFIAVIAVT
jgi:hypothetical protein